MSKSPFGPVGPVPITTCTLTRRLSPPSLSSLLLRHWIPFGALPWSPLKCPRSNDTTTSRSITFCLRLPGAIWTHDGYIWPPRIGMPRHPTATAPFFQWVLHLAGSDWQELQPPDPFYPFIISVFWFVVRRLSINQSINPSLNQSSKQAILL